MWLTDETFLMYRYICRKMPTYVLIFFLELSVVVILRQSFKNTVNVVQVKSKDFICLPNLLLLLMIFTEMFTFSQKYLEMKWILNIGNYFRLHVCLSFFVLGLHCFIRLVVQDASLALCDR